MRRCDAMARTTMKHYGFHTEGTQASGSRESGGSVTAGDRSSPENKSFTSKSTPIEPSFRHWALVLLVIAFSVFYHKWDNRSRSLSRSFPGSPNTPAVPDTILRLGENTFLAAAGDAAILATVEMDVEAGASMTRYYENDLPILKDWLRDNCCITADVTIPVTVKAGFRGDLLGAEDVIVEYLPDGRLVVTVQMPSPVIVSCCPDYSEIVRLSTETHYPNSAANLIELLAGLDAQLMENARNNAEAAGIFDRARANARDRMTWIMSALGADSVVVVFRSDAAQVKTTGRKDRS